MQVSNHGSVKIQFKSRLLVPTGYKSKRILTESNELDLNEFGLDNNAI